MDPERMEVTLIADSGATFRIPLGRLIDSFSKQINLSRQDLLTHLFRFNVAPWKEFYLELNKGDVLVSSDGFPSSLIVDTNIYAENWLTFNPKIANMCLK